MKRKTLKQTPSKPDDYFVILATPLGDTFKAARVFAFGRWELKDGEELKFWYDHHDK